ncbi:hypothetical protein COCNU_scaffold009544G000010 [Cocos nucifera]|nr:hypothetical protein [Cocos nucifera]
MYKVEEVMVKVLQQLKMPLSTELLYEDLLKRLRDLSVRKLCGLSEKRKEKKRKKLVMSPSLEAAIAKVTIAKVGVTMAEAIDLEAAKINLLREKQLNKGSISAPVGLLMIAREAEEERDKAKERLAIEKSRADTVETALRENNISLKEAEKDLQIKMDQLQESEAEADRAQDQARWVKKAAFQVKKEAAQARMAQSWLANKATTVEHLLGKAAAKDVEDFRKSEVFSSGVPNVMSESFLH